MIIEPLELPPLYRAQANAIASPARISIIEASTKSGKTTGCLCWLLSLAWNTGRLGRVYWWVAPIRPTAKAIGYARMVQMLVTADPTGRAWSKSDGELWIKLANGAKIEFKGGDKPDSLYGQDVYGAVIDEATRVKEGSWHAVRSTMTATRAPIRIIGNVKGSHNWVYKLARETERGIHPDCKVYRLTAYDAAAAGVFPAEEIEAARRTLPRDVFRELYEAQASDSGGGMFDFTYEFNVRPVAYNRERTIVVGSDFNVDPMAWTLGHKGPDTLEWFDEIWIEGTNTRKTLDVLAGRYGDHPGGWQFYGDATGRARKTSASESDYVQICNDQRFLKMGRTVHYPLANGPIKNRVDAANAMFRAADGRFRMFMDPKLEHLINDCEYRRWKPGTFEPDDPKGGYMGHISDAMTYAVVGLFPLRVDRPPQGPVIIRRGAA